MARDVGQFWRLIRWTAHYYLPEHDVTFETENGLLSCRSTDWLIGKHLFVRRSHEMDLIRSSMSFLRREGIINADFPCRIMLDVGANIGMNCIAMLRAGYFEKAIAFEPSPGSFRLLKRNVRQNDLCRRVDCRQLALSSMNSDVVFELDERNTGDSRVRRVTSHGEMGEISRKTIAVAAKKFDDLTLENGDKEKIDLVWMDVQGHEGHFFSGAREFFRDRKIPVISEFWGYGIRRSGMTADEYGDIVRETFSKLYVYEGRDFVSTPLKRIGELFARFSRPREMGTIILI